MPEKSTMRRARKDKRQGKAPTTQAGEYVREEMHHIRQGKHGARSPQQAIAIGLSKARRSGVSLPPPSRGSSALKRKAEHDEEIGEMTGGRHKTSSKRSRAVRSALGREGRSAASKRSLSRQGHTAAMRRGKSSRAAAAKKASHTKGPMGRKRAARKAARTRRSHAS
jgi:hypothetical protein